MARQLNIMLMDYWREESYNDYKKPKLVSIWWTQKRKYFLLLQIKVHKYEKSLILKQSNDHQ